jgi:hypothetical protein
MHAHWKAADIFVQLSAIGVPGKQGSVDSG